jgi:hypothetical protein
MNSKLILPFVSLVIIAILSGSLIYEVVQRHQDEKNYQRFFIVFGVKLYQGLQQGDIEGVKRRLGGDVAANALLYEQKYGHEYGKEFEPRLNEADMIVAEIRAGNK